jgi:hypothetical protein
VIQLPFDPPDYAQARIYVREDWRKPWRLLPPLTPAKNGFELSRVRRAALPSPDEAVFFQRYGEIDEKLYTPIEVQDQCFVLINLIGEDGTTETNAFVGRLVAVRESRMPGAHRQIGQLEYHCNGAIEILKGWRLDRHQSYELAALCKENPGYNFDGLKDRINTDPTDLGYDAHTYPGSDNATHYWTDEQVIAHALKANDKPASDPNISLAGTLDALQAWGKWEVTEGDNVAELAGAVLARTRGVGVAFFRMTGSPWNTIQLVVQAQQLDDITVESVVLPGAETEATAVDVDLEGDQRLGEQAQQTFEVSDIQDQYYDAVEVLGERIQVLALLTRDPSGSEYGLADRWTTDQATAYDALGGDAEATPDLAGVYKAYGLPVSSVPVSGDGNTASLSGRCDYRCSDLGLVIDPIQAGLVSDTPASIVNILPDLPLYTGYDYSGASPSISADAALAQVERMPIRLFSWEPNVWDDLTAPDQTTRRTIKLVGPDIFVEGLSQQGLRFGEEEEKIAFLVGLEMPHRLRYKVYREGMSEITARRTKRIFIAGAHLWLAHQGSAWGIDDAGEPRRFTGVSQIAPYELRDDVAEVRKVAAMAAQWYLKKRKTCSWTLKGCGLSNGWFAAGENGEVGTLTAWPQLGAVVRNLDAGGKRDTIDTPITFIEYDHARGETSWSTGWGDRDWTRGGR